MRLQLRNGKRVLWASLLLGLICGCATSPSPFRYSVTIPMLEVTPKVAPCQLKDASGVIVASERCVTLVESDLIELIVELKAACLALGNTPTQCQTEE